MKFLPRLFLFLSLLVVILFIGTSVISYQYGDEIKSTVVDLLNQQLKTKVDVNEIEFSLFRDFPKASVVFNEVAIYAVEAENDTLLYANKISTSFNLLDIYHEKYELTTLIIEKGKCDLVVDNSGRRNFEFWEPANDSSRNANAQIVLDEVEILEVAFSYQDFSANSTTLFNIDKAELKGAFHDNLFEASLIIDLNKLIVISENKSLFKFLSVHIDMDGKVDQEAESIAFSEAELNLDGILLKTTGNYTYNDKNFLELVAESEEINLEKAINLLPQSIEEKLKDYEINGNAAIKGKLKGIISSTSVPDYSFEFGLSNAVLKSQKHDLKFNNLGLSGEISNEAESHLTIDTFSTNFKEGSLSGQFELKNFNAPKYSTSIAFQMMAEELTQLFEISVFENVEGKIAGTIKANGKLKELNKFDSNDWKTAKVNAKVKLDAMHLNYVPQNIKIEQLNTELIVENNSIYTTTLNAIVNENAIELSGQFNNLIPYLFDDKAPLLIDVELTSPEILLDNFSNQSTASEKSTEVVHLNSRIQVYANVNTERIRYKEFLIKDLSTQFIFKSGKLQLNDCRYQAHDGKVIGDVILSQNNDLSFNFLAEVTADNISIKQLFEDFKNFDQTSVRAENLNGTTNIEIEVKGKLSPSFELNTASLRSDASISIKDGQLSNFKPLYKLSDYIEIEELKNVRFKKLQNQILINNKTIFIPQFEINSSALDLNLSGIHRFDGQIDYHVNLYLNELLSKKAKKPENSEFGYIEEVEGGRSRLFLTIGGTTDDPIVKYDKKAVKEKNRVQFAKEKQTLKNLLKEEFGLFKKDETLQKPSAPRKKSPFQIEYDSSFKQPQKNTNKTQKNPPNKEETKEKKSKFGKFLDKIAKPNEDEFVDP